MPVARWVAPEEFDELKRIGEAMGIGHVEASPLTRSSYHAKQAASDALATPSSALTLAADTLAADTLAADTLAANTMAEGLSFA
jgi:lipoic acid synthetase